MGDGFNLTPEGKRIFRELDKLGEMVVKVGFQMGEKYPNGTRVLDVAAFNEFGTESIPSRPFMRDSVYHNEDEIKAFLQSKVVDIIKDGKSAKQLLNEIGNFQTDVMQDTIEEGMFVLNAPSTILRKKSTNPLIDTGTMKNSIHYQIKKKR